MCKIKISFAIAFLVGYVNDLLNEALTNNDIHALSVAFLLIRQVSLQGGHVFQPYVTWFQVLIYVVVDVKFCFGLKCFTEEKINFRPETTLIKPQHGYRLQKQLYS